MCFSKSLHLSQRETESFFGQLPSKQKGSTLSFAIARWFKKCKYYHLDVNNIKHYVKILKAYFDIFLVSRMIALYHSQLQDVQNVHNDG